MPTEITASTLTVTQVSQAIGQALAGGFPQLIWLEGEISGFKVWGRPTAKAWFFDLKDNTSTLSAVVWASDMRNLTAPREGEQVRVLARVSWASKQGRINLNVRQIQPAGLGALLIEIERRRTALVNDGLTAAERKRPIPNYPQRIGLVTSASSAAAADVMRVTRLRWPLAEIRVFNTGVQGEGAPAQIIQALDDMDREGGLDVCLLVRGGGSLTDLMAFNDEALCRRLTLTHCPVITGVGHETDTGLVDWVSDLYAATPSNAAELATPDQDTVKADIQRQTRQLRQGITGQLSHARNRLTQCQSRLANPAQLFATKRQLLERSQRDLTRQAQLDLEQKRLRLAQLIQRLQAHDPRHRISLARQRHQALAERLAANPMRHRWQSAKHQLDRLTEQLKQQPAQRLQTARRKLSQHQASLRALDPKGVLNRGYAYVENANGQVLQRGDQLQLNQPLTLRMQDHETMDVGVRVERLEPKPSGT